MSGEQLEFGFMAAKHGERRYDHYKGVWQEWDSITDNWWDLPEPISKSLPRPKLKYDPHVLKLTNKYLDRSEFGQVKYGTTLDRKDVDLVGWLVHLQEELMDATLYIERTIYELKDEHGV